MPGWTFLCTSVPAFFNELFLEFKPVFVFLSLGGFEIEISEASFDFSLAGARNLSPSHVSDMRCSTRRDDFSNVTYF